MFKVQHDENRAISNRVFIALSQSHDNRLVCLTLCGHSDFVRQDVQDIHAEVRKTVGDQEPPTLEVGLRLDPKRNLNPRVYVNLEHPYTISIESLKVTPCGRVTDVENLINNHPVKYQAMMLEEWN